MNKRNILRSELLQLQAKLGKLVQETDEEDEDGIEEIGMLEDKIDKLITQYEDLYFST